MLARRQRRWANIKTTLGRCLQFAGHIQKNAASKIHERCAICGNVIDMDQPLADVGGT